MQQFSFIISNPFLQFRHLPRWEPAFLNSQGFDVYLDLIALVPTMNVGTAVVAILDADLYAFNLPYLRTHIPS
jgi:hypothetical protein